MYQKYKQLIPLVILILFFVKMLTSAISGVVSVNGLYYNFVPGVKHILAFVAIILCVTSFVLFRRYYKYFLLATLLLSLGNVINFNSTENNVSFAISGVKLAFQPMIFLVIFLTYVINFKRANTFLGIRINETSEVVSNKEQPVSTELIETFKAKYKSRSDEELNTIANTATYVPAAVMAAREILEERQNNYLKSKTV